MEETANEDHPSGSMAVKDDTAQRALSFNQYHSLMDASRLMLTPKNITKDSNDVIHATVLEDISLS